MNAGGRVRVILLGRAVTRAAVRQALLFHEEVEIAGSTADPVVARELAAALRADAVVLEADDGTRGRSLYPETEIAALGVPVITVSSALGGGARADRGAAGESAAIEAPADSAPIADDAGFSRKLIAALLQATRRPLGSRSLARAEVTPLPAAESCAGVIGIGASTGGTNALAVLFAALPADLPGVVVVQHMPKNFTRAFARRLNDLSALEIREAEDGDPVRPGTALIAPGDRHLVLEGARPRFCVRTVDGPPVNHQRPAVDVLFRSMAQRAGTLAVGLLLTGMGGDGAQGLLEIRQRGGRTIAQDEKTSVIFGMPREAIRLGAAERVAPLPMMAPLLASIFRPRDRARSA